MKDATDAYRRMVASVPAELKTEVDLSFKISGRIDYLMREKGLSKNQCGVSSFFGSPIVSVN